MTILRNHPPRHLLVKDGKITVQQPGIWQINLDGKECFLNVNYEHGKKLYRFRLSLVWGPISGWVAYHPSFFDLFEQRPPRKCHIELNIGRAADHTQAQARALEAITNILLQRQELH